MRDGGERLRELVHSPADLAPLGGAPPRVRRAPARARAARSTSCSPPASPIDRLAILPGRLAALLDDRDACFAGIEDQLSEDEYERVRAILPEYAERCERLAAFGIPETIQHDDLHDGNVFVRDGRYLFFDWGDSCVSHPFHSLVVTPAPAPRRKWELPPGGPDILRLRDAYLEPFAAYGTRDELVEAADLAHFTGTAARALNWYRFIYAREPEFRTGDEDAVPYGLRRLLDIGPIGSWS